MEIYQLKDLDYKINEAEAFGKSVFNNSGYTVDLAVPAGTELGMYIKDGDMIEGNYTASGLRTEFESVIQDVSLKRAFQAGYDMYDLTISENALSVDRASIIPVEDGGTGRGELRGILKGDGLQPIVQAEAGVDYVEPLIPNVDWTAITPQGSSTVSDPLDFSWAILSNVLYVRVNNMSVSYTSSESRNKTLGKITLPTGVKVPFQVEGVINYRIAGGVYSPARLLVMTNGDVVMAAQGALTGAQSGSIGVVLPYPIVKS